MALRRQGSKHNPFGGAAGVPSFTIGAETGGNTRNVAIQFGTSQGSCAVPWYLSDNADGSSVAATAPSGGIAIGTDGLLIPYVAGKSGLMVSEADGDVDVNIVEAGADTFYLVLVMPDGSLAISGAITFA